MDRWCREHAIAKGVVVPLEQVWQLARLWYAGRTEEHWTPRSPEAAEQLFASLGLTGEFWRL